MEVKSSVESSVKPAMTIDVDETFVRHLTYFRDHNVLSSAEADDITSQIHFYEIHRPWIDSLAEGWQQIAIVAESVVGTRDHTDLSDALRALIDYSNKRWPHRMIYVPASTPEVVAL